MQKNVLVYTIHKAGSTFLDLLMSQTARRLSIHHLSENQDANFDAIHNSSWKQFIEDHSKQKSASFETSCFGPIRGSIDQPIFPDDLQRYSVILHLRDPRDILTSMFFSYAYSHTVRSGRFEATDEQRNQWRENGIDKFVLSAAPALKQTFDKLRQRLLGHPHVTLVHYEQMVLDYPNWLSNYLSAFCHLSVPTKKRRHLFLPQSVRRKKIQNQLLLKHQDSFTVASENVFEHKRRVTPGDHKEKLAGSTIQALDSIFAEHLEIRSDPNQRSA